MENNRNNTSPNQDPRIDSPNIRVSYPPETVIPKDPIKSSGTEISKETAEIKTVQPLGMTKSDYDAQTLKVENQVSVVSWLGAIKQNASVFLLIGVGVFALGYFIGKNKG